MSRGIYVASRASIPERPAMWRALRDSGQPIASTWIDEAGPGQTVDMSELWDRISEEVCKSAGVVLYAELDDFPLKGAFIETGMALGMHLPVVVVCPGMTQEQVRSKVGSWVEHPMVRRAETAEEACALILSWDRLLGMRPKPPVAEPDPRGVPGYCRGCRHQLDEDDMEEGRCLGCGIIIDGALGWGAPIASFTAATCASCGGTMEADHLCPTMHPESNINA